MKRWLKITLSAARAWKDDNVFKHSAAVSFYTLFSLVPITVIALTVAGAVFGRETARDQLQKQVTALIGPASAELLQSAAQAGALKGESVMSTVIGVALLLFGATTVFAQLQESLNAIWGVKTKPNKAGIVLLVFQRLLSLAMVLTVGFLMLVSLILTTALTSMVGRFGSTLLGSAALLKIADIAVSLVVITVLFGLLFKVLPDVKLRWKDAWLGAVIAAVLFTVGRYLIALYLGHSTVASVYGTAGSLVALLIWVYYSCAILFFGVEFTHACRAADHLHIEPKATAVVVREQVVTGARGKATRAA